MIFNLKSNLCRLVFNHGVIHGVLVLRFGVSVFLCLSDEHIQLSLSFCELPELQVLAWLVTFCLNILGITFPCSRTHFYLICV